MCSTNSEMDVGKCITCLDVQIIISNIRYKGVKKQWRSFRQNKYIISI